MKIFYKAAALLGMQNWKLNQTPFEISRTAYASASINPIALVLV